jgi:hypothetical protein
MFELNTLDEPPLERYQPRGAYNSCRVGRNTDPCWWRAFRFWRMSPHSFAAAASKSPLLKVSQPRSLAFVTDMRACDALRRHMVKENEH